MGTGISDTKYENLDQICISARTIFDELVEAAHPEAGDILVVGCSSSEVAAHKIGTFSSEEIGKALFKTLNNACKEKGLYLACQCCEHLNRAIIVEKKCAKEKDLEMVNVKPQLKAGGSFATAAFNGFDQAVAVEHIKADLGIDIGDTLIGMHLKDVAVPVRVSLKSIGNAHVVCARTRLKYIGGPRAAYQ
jgi:uncharacterized protein (TIGR01440 family)